MARAATAFGLHHWHRGTGIWLSRDIATDGRHIAGLPRSLSTLPPAIARRPARKAALFDLGAIFPLRDGLSAGGNGILTLGPRRDYNHQNHRVDGVRLRKTVQ